MNDGIQCSQFDKIYNSSEIRNIYNKIDKNELEQYYFMKKVGSAISSFAKKFNLRKELYFNDSIWNEIFEL